MKRNLIMFGFEGCLKICLIEVDLSTIVFLTGLRNINTDRSLYLLKIFNNQCNLIAKHKMTRIRWFISLYFKKNSVETNVASPDPIFLRTTPDYCLIRDSCQSFYIKFIQKFRYTFSKLLRAELHGRRS